MLTTIAFALRFYPAQLVSGLAFIGLGVLGFDIDQQTATATVHADPWVAADATFGPWPYWGAGAVGILLVVYALVKARMQHL